MSKQTPLSGSSDDFDPTALLAADFGDFTVSTYQQYLRTNAYPYIVNGYRQLV